MTSPLFKSLEQYIQFIIYVLIVNNKVDHFSHYSNDGFTILTRRDGAGWDS